MAYSRSRFLGLIGSIASSGIPMVAHAQTAPLLRLGSVFGDSYAEPYYGVDQGLFAQAGLNVDLLSFASSSAITTAVLTGALDVGISNPIVVANAVDHGIPLRFFAAAALNDPNTIGLCVAADSAIKVAKDLNGKTVATTALKDSNSLQVRAWIDQNGGDSTTLQLVEIAPFSAMAAAVHRGTVVAAPLGEPDLTAALTTGGLRMIGHTTEVYGQQSMIGGFIARTDWLEQHSALAGKFAKALYMVAHWANTHRDDTELTVVKYAKLDRATVHGMHRVPYPESFSPSMFQTYLDLGYKYQYISRHFDANELMVKV